MLDVLVVDAEERFDGPRRKLNLLQKAVSSPSRGESSARRPRGRMRCGETGSFMSETTLQHCGLSVNGTRASAAVNARRLAQEAARTALRSVFSAASAAP